MRKQQRKLMLLQDNLLRIKKKQKAKGQRKQQLPPLPDLKLSKMRKQDSTMSNPQVDVITRSLLKLQEMSSCNRWSRPYWLESGGNRHQKCL